MLDTCGGHAMPYHYHNDLYCDYNHLAPGHSPLIGFALDGYGIYGLKCHAEVWVLVVGGELLEGARLSEPAAQQRFFAGS